MHLCSDYAVIQHFFASATPSIFVYSPKILCIISTLNVHHFFSYHVTIFSLYTQRAMKDVMEKYSYIYRSKDFAHQDNINDQPPNFRPLPPQKGQIHSSELDLKNLLELIQSHPN